MRTIQMRVLSLARRVRDSLVEHDVNSDSAELTALRQELDETLSEPIRDAATKEAIATQPCVQTTTVRRLRRALRESQLEPIVWTTRSMKLAISGDDIAFVRPPFGVNSERLAATGDAIATVLTVLGLQFVARGLASNFLELLRNASWVLRIALAITIGRAWQFSNRLQHASTARVSPSHDLSPLSSFRSNEAGQSAAPFI